MFAADLGRALATETSLSVHYALTKTSTYGNEVGGSHDRRVNIDLAPSDVAGRSMLLVDDILDHGFTLAALRDRLSDWGVRSVQVCVLLDKQLEDPKPQILICIGGTFHNLDDIPLGHKKVVSIRRSGSIPLHLPDTDADTRHAMKMHVNPCQRL